MFQVSHSGRRGYRRAGSLPAVRPEDGEYLVRIGYPRLEKHGFVGLAVPQLVHRAGQAEPVEKLVMAAVLGFLDRRASPQIPVAVPERLVVALVRFDVGEHERMLAHEKGMAPAR